MSKRLWNRMNQSEVKWGKSPLLFESCKFWHYAFVLYVVFSSEKILRNPDIIQNGSVAKLSFYLTRRWLPFRFRACPWGCLQEDFLLRWFWHAAQEVREAQSCPPQHRAGGQVRPRKRRDQGVKPQRLPGIQDDRVIFWKPTWVWQNWLKVKMTFLHIAFLNPKQIINF